MPLLRNAAAIIFVLAMPAFLVLSNVRIAASNPAVQQWGFDRYDVTETTRVTGIELDAAAEDIARYFRDDRQALDTQVHIDGEEVALFNPREVGHMRDVKVLMQGAFRAQEMTFVYLALYICFVVLWARERSLRRFARLSMVAGLVTVGVLTAAALAMMVGFEELFLQFHLFSFSNDLWQLDPATDRLIQMFPLGFWFEVSLAIGVISILEGGALALAGFLVGRRSSRAPWGEHSPISRGASTLPAR